MFSMPALKARGNVRPLALELGISLEICKFCVLERISDFFSITLEAFCEDANVDVGAIIDFGARFELRRGVESRAWPGIVSHAQFVELAEKVEEGQAERIVLNLNDSPVNPSDVKDILASNSCQISPDFEGRLQAAPNFAARERLPTQTPLRGSIQQSPRLCRGLLMRFSRRTFPAVPYAC